MSQLPVFLKQLDVRNALTTPPPVPDHVLPGLPIGAVGTVVAPGGTGKSMLLLQSAVDMAIGRPFLGGRWTVDLDSTPTDSARVVLVAAEESVDEMRRRLHHVVAHAIGQLGAPLMAGAPQALLQQLHENLAIYPLAGRGRLPLDAADGSSTTKALHGLSEGARLVVLDPLRQFHSGDENDSWTMTALVQTCQMVAEKNRCAFVFAHHTTKYATLNGLGDQAGASRGSAALTDAVRWQLNLAAVDDALAKQYGLDASERRGHIKVELAKANYIGVQAPIVLKKEPGGVLTPVAPLNKTRMKKST